MRISTSKSEDMVLNWKKVVCPLQPESMTQVEEFKYVGVLFTSEGRWESEIERWCISSSNAVDDVVNSQSTFLPSPIVIRFGS